MSKNEIFNNKAAQKPKAFYKVQSCSMAVFIHVRDLDSQRSQNTRSGKGTRFCLRSSSTGKLVLHTAHVQTPSPCCHGKMLPVQNNFIFSAWLNWQQNACFKRRLI